MNRAARTVLRNLGTDINLDDEREHLTGQELDEAREREQQRAEQEKQRSSGREESGLSGVPENMLTESEKRHENYRRRMANSMTPAAERLPIMTAAERQARDKDRPKYHATEFEGPIEKLIEKYQDLSEVERHLTLGQSMKYEFTENGHVLDRDGNVIFDGQNIVAPAKKR